MIKSGMETLTSIFFLLTMKEMMKTTTMSNTSGFSFRFKTQIIQLFLISLVSLGFHELSRFSALLPVLQLAGEAFGWGRLDDSVVVKVYETLTGVKVEGKLVVINKTSALKSLPSKWALDQHAD
ncbi:hypothetical protein L1987_14872 [Smallanthus sonchifolius]|uniref:Uncharacterized protein n=1 Tax=Smallanthus sonchifolius TaxID=185202 RepID=A0ACB9J4E6_9ASTR|nr:hypothetical protein L1987_14872 [Smallanthus sonchifolius]